MQEFQALLASLRLKQKYKRADQYQSQIWFIRSNGSSAFINDQLISEFLTVNLQDVKSSKP